MKRMLRPAQAYCISTVAAILTSALAFGHDAGDSPTKTAPVLKRMQKRTDEDLRKQLLSVHEAGLDQQAAAKIGPRPLSTSSFHLHTSAARPQRRSRRHRT
jgi:hypothetical protein